MKYFENVLCLLRPTLRVCLPQTKLLKFSVLQTISVKNLHKKSKNTNVKKVS